jgi:hypothetical protein
MFPQVDPIPLPAPVWLFKVLEILTVTLHFLAVQLLLGGLLVAVWWSVASRRGTRAASADAAGGIANRLPILMVYVINFGVPPLLFSQVLYGRAIYTSSILIGVAWIAVIPLLMMVYSLLYVLAGRARQGRAWWWIGCLAFAMAGGIALIYASNMSLMIRPQAWVEMYRSDALGTRLNTGDPTLWPRWLFMLAAGLCTSGAGLMFLGLVPTLSGPATRHARRWGPPLVAVGVVAQVALGYWVVVAQPESVKTALGAHGGYRLVIGTWLALAAALFVAALWARRHVDLANWRWAGILGALVFLQVAAMVVIRGGLRDLALAGHGLDVWDRQVHNNWLVTGAFLVFFVWGLAVIGWLVTVMYRAKRVEERYV